MEYTKSIPLYVQLKNTIKQDIRTGLLKPGDQLPSEAQLQEKYNMSRVTVRNAMKELTAEGYIVKVQGKGSFVAMSDMLRLPIGVTSFTSDAKMQGISLTSKVIFSGLQDLSSDLDRSFFGDTADGKVMVVKRVRYANGVPIIVEENHFSPEMITLEEENLEGSLYEILMNQYHVIPCNKGRRSIHISYATPEIAEYLDISMGTPVIDSELGVFDMNGKAVHTVRDIVRGDNERYMKWYV